MSGQIVAGGAGGHWALCQAGQRVRLRVVRHLERDEIIANADDAAPVRRFRPLAEAERRGLPVLYAHLALSIAMDAELRALAVHANECPLALIACGTPTGLNLRR
jgi:hypothetical protein